MKKSYLRQIIKEELAKINEADARSLQQNFSRISSNKFDELMDEFGEGLSGDEVDDAALDRIYDGCHKASQKFDKECHQVIKKYLG